MRLSLKYIIPLCVFSLTAMGQSLFDQSIPIQQFVVSESTEEAKKNEAAAAQQAESAADTNPQSAPPLLTDNMGDPIFPTHAPLFPAPKSSEQLEAAAAQAEAQSPAEEEVPAVRTAVPLSTLPFQEDSAEGNGTGTSNEFAGGMHEQAFMVCSRMATGVCLRARNEKQFDTCLARLARQPNCEQFIAFTKKVSFGQRDEVDLVQYFKEGQLNLVHVVRLGASYPGDYYTVGVNGDFVNITTGSEIKGINITSALRYPEIVSRFPKARLWSVVDKLPLASTSPTGGLRLIFRFALLNGCATCDLAGYANVAYDYSDAGALQGVGLLGLDPILSH